VYRTAIAHDIHEQSLVHRRSLILLGHTPNSRIPIDDELRSAFLPPLNEFTVVRREETAMSSFTPIFSNFTEEDIQAIEKERERESKRKKRGGRARRGIILPDREPIKTHRTRLNLKGPDGLIAPPVVPEPVVPVQATTSRRAAAIAANANIILINQDLPIPQPPSPVPLPPPPPKVRKQRAGFGRGVSRHSLEGSVAPSDAVATPIGWGGKKEEEEPESPMPGVISRRRNGRVVNSPPGEGDAVVKLEGRGQGSGSRLEGDVREWRCRNCGVPRHLTRDIRSDPISGELSLCGMCGEFPP
jgi:SWI/SNF-related matrix-associated actin-dependent regulator of chromatin subfamily B protein 1